MVYPHPGVWLNEGCLVCVFTFGKDPHGQLYGHLLDVGTAVVEVVVPSSQLRRRIIQVSRIGQCPI